MLQAELFKRKKNGVSYDELNRYLEEKFKENGRSNELKFSEKTFKRDRNDLYELFGLEVIYDRANQVYKLTDGDDIPENVFDHFLLLEACRQLKKHSDIMLFEKRRSAGLENLFGLVHAIQNQKVIHCNYTDFWNHEAHPKPKVLEPYGLKEFHYRWYLLANDRNSKTFQIKTYGLDRMSQFEIVAARFDRQPFDMETIFKNSFGIISTLDQKPEKIILSFSAVQGRYVKSLPLHPSQKILIDNENTLQIELTLVPTYDFYQELLRVANSVTVVSPKAVREELVKMMKVGVALNG